jgi:hypothetical protein
MHDTNQDEPRGNAIWELFFAIVIAIVWTLYDLSGDLVTLVKQMSNGEADYAYGRITGASVIVVVIVWAVLYFTAVRRRAPGRGPLYFLVILGVTLAADIGVVQLVQSAANSNDNQFKTMASDLRATFGAINDKSTASAVDTPVNAQGDAGVLERTAKSFVAIRLTDRQNYAAELKALGYPDFLSPHNLAADKHMVATRAKLAQARAIVKKYAALTEARFPAFHTAIQKLPVNEALKRQFLSGFDDSVAREKPQRDRLWVLEDSILAEREKIAALMAHPGKPWVVRGKMILFGSNADLAAYNAHIAAINAMRNEELSLRANAQQTLNNDMQRVPPPQ